jgi:hypothetical protein
MVVFLSIAAYSVDMSFLYWRKARAQQAADAGALAGAFMLANLYPVSTATQYASSYTSYNGYTNGAADGSTVQVTYPVPGLPANYFRVRVVRPEQTRFAGVFGMNRVNVGATSTALYMTLAPMNINGGGTYGMQDGPTTLSLFGPDGFYNNGDCYSVRELPNGTANPLYTGKGYDFEVNVPSSLSNTVLEIFDPDCYNASGGSGSVADASPGRRVDEYRTPSGGGGNSSHATTTRYNLYADNGTPGNPNDDYLIQSRSYGNTSTTDMKWNSVFSFNRNNYPGQNFRLNVTSTDGSSENGFDLRAGPPRSGSTAFNPNNGTSITAQGHLPMNFNESGQATVTLGYVPVEAAGSQLTIRKFDTDVGSTQVTYTCDTLPGMTFPGVLSGQGEFATDNLTIPSSYTGGTWKATYSAGAQDTSVWDMAYSGYGPGRPGGVKLVE